MRKTRLIETKEVQYGNSKELLIDSDMMDTKTKNDTDYNIRDEQFSNGNVIQQINNTIMNKCMNIIEINGVNCRVDYYEC